MSWDRRFRLLSGLSDKSSVAGRFHPQPVNTSDVSLQVKGFDYLTRGNFGLVALPAEIG
jgi:hypothetical protein